MKKSLIHHRVLFTMIMTLCLFNPKILLFSLSDNATKLKGKYLGQKPPGVRAVKFNEGMLVGDKRSFNVSFSPDGKHIFFTSDRPHPKSADMDIYYLEKKESRWSKPIYAGNEVNTIHNEVHAVLSAKRNLFFASNRPGGFGDKDLYRAEWIEGRFTLHCIRYNKTGGWRSTPNLCIVSNR